jgi:methanethiol S-methyltransferase
MNQISKIAAYATAVLAGGLGGAALLLFGAFLVRGPFSIVDLGYTTSRALLFDGVLCLAFFLQHSLMVRRSFHRQVRSLLSAQYGGALYTIASALVLLVLVILWQRTSPALGTIEGLSRWLLHGLCLAGLAGFVWGARSLTSFDALGVRPIIAHISGAPSPNPVLTVKGPYRWVRHPLYLGSLFLIWSSPEMTPDRLLFNGAFTIWIVIGAILEERDLVAQFGAAYVDYQRRVPMLIPWHFPRER